ncbi:hypothetical protein OCS_01260 [Ophiocordyceps sinensis CO18]|uniref:Uncharacterized protein n=1 Tax=Ophiocordyceps sinensis (strain Co18 / CGMCC 3.14243) TaxID=911162 RepID=T5AKU7_OPHSC|nr:hypothetical protein OCS_01260 [Ophiocordyceps sinensis CO18]
MSRGQRESDIICKSLMAMYWDGMGCHGMPLPPHAAPKQIRAFWQCPEDNGSPTSSASPATGGKSEPLFAQRFWLAAHHKDQDRGNGSLPPLDVSARRLEIARFADTYMHTCIRTWEASRLECARSRAQASTRNLLQLPFGWHGCSIADTPLHPSRQAKSTSTHEYGYRIHNQRNSLKTLEVLSPHLPGCPHPPVAIFRARTAAARKTPQTQFPPSPPPPGYRTLVGCNASDLQTWNPGWRHAAQSPLPWSSRASPGPGPSLDTYAPRAYLAQVGDSCRDFGKAIIRLG